MRPHQIILALAIVLGFAAGEALADVMISTDHDYTVTVLGHSFGFTEGRREGWGHESEWHKIHLGPFGEKYISFSAKQGLAFCSLTFGLLVFTALAIIVWRRRWRAKPVE